MNLQDFECLLKALQLMSPKQRRSFFQLATAEQMRAFEEGCYNLVKNKKVNSAEIKKISKVHGSTIKELARKGNSIKIKKTLLTQKGGFLGILLSALASIVTSIITSQIEKNT